MADERSVRLPEGCDWKTLVSKSGTDLTDHYVDMLRNERPVYAYLNSDKPQWNSLKTSKEPVGEQEG